MEYQTTVDWRRFAVGRCCGNLFFSEGKSDRSAWRSMYICHYIGMYAFINPAKHIVVSAGLYWNSDCKYFWVVCDCMVFRMYTERDHPFTCMDAGVRMYRDCDVSVL